MRRMTITPRADWRERARTVGFDFAEISGHPYWDETACRRFSAGEVDVLDDATAVWPLVVRSWERREMSLYGRMDLRWDGSGPPKLLEYNADTPTSLYEASVVQWERLTSAFPAADQFNAIHEAPFLFIDEIGWNGKHFTDMQDREIRAAFKLYPWEWLLRDTFGNNIAAAETRWIDPAWRMLLSGRGILPLLWKLFPGPYGAEDFVHQQWAELPCTDGRYAVIGSWLIEGVPRGIGMREDTTPITRDTSRFVPHFCDPRATDAESPA